MSIMRRLSNSEIRRRRVNEDAEDSTTDLSITDDPEEEAERESQEEKYFVHGDVYFAENPGEISKFMVVPSDAQVEDVLAKFKSYWNLDIPRVALFVISDPSRKFAWKDSHNMSALVSGLVNALNTIEMWIFTNGLDAGITMEIGRGFRAELLKRQEAAFSHVDSYCTEYHTGVSPFTYPEVALIGTCGYNSLTYARSLIKFNRPIRLENGRYIYMEDTYDLNSDHTHFLVVKDEKPTDALDFLFKIADQMAKSFEHHSEFKLTSSGARHVRISEVSVVSLLLQGGLKALDYIRKYLKRKLPLVVVKGSGGLADLLAYTYHEVNNMPNGSNPAEYAEKVLKHLICVKAVTIFPSLEKSAFAQVSVYEKLLQCVRFGSREESKLLTVLDTTQRSRLDELPHHLLKALFKCKPAIAPGMRREIYMRQDLHLAMDWNSPLIAMEEVLAKGTDVISTIDEQLFMRALLKPQREGFVEMFLQRGFQVHKILSSKMFVLLFRASAKQEFFRNVILESMMGENPDLVIEKVFIDTTLARFLEIVAGLSFLIRTKDLDRIFKGKCTDYHKDEAEEKALVALIVWAICTYRLDLLKPIWKNSSQPIRLSIFISMMLKRINEYVYELPIKNHIKKHRIMFTKIGTDILDVYYKHVPSRALSFIQEKSSVWCYKTVMEIAAFADNKRFLSHPCCQRYLDSVFMGNIRLKSKPTIFKYSMWLKILLSAFLVFPMYIWITFYASIDYLAERNINKKNKDLKYIQQRFISFKDQKYPEEEERFQDTKYAFDDADPTAYFYGPVLHLREINPPLLYKIYYMWMAPITKFWVYHLFYLLYLIFYSAVLLYPTCGNFELDTVFFMWTIFISIDSAYAVYVIYKRYRQYYLKCDILQTVVLVFILFAFGANRIATRNKFISSYYMRLIMCCTLLYLFYRFIWTIMPISSILGPLLFRMKRMVFNDFGNFLKISSLFMVSNTIIIDSLLYPDAYLDFKRLFSMVRELFKILFITSTIDLGEENRDCVPSVRGHRSENSCWAGRYTNTSCANYNIWPWLFYIQYVTPMKYLLVPILYGMFAVTHRMFQKKSNEIWKFHRYRLVMEFQERLLPLPFSLITYVYRLTNYILMCCSPSHKRSSAPQESIETFATFKYQESTYLLRLFKKHYKTIELGENEEQCNVRKEMEMMNVLGEGLRHQKKIVTDLESHLMDLQIGLNYTKKYLLHKSEKELEKKTDKKVPQLLSRQNPYPHTQIKRYPVPDKRVSWEIDWFMYDPVAYTLAKENFDNELKDYVDEDLHLWMQYDLENTSKKPEFLWNQAVDTAAGIFVNRRTWITDKYGQPICYKIDFEGLPQNPLGRTGLRGKGFLPRWGPNIYVYAFVSLWYLTSSGSETRNLRFVAINKESEQNGEQTTLPGGFAASSEVYDVVQNFFITDQTDSNLLKWDSSEAMISFFRSCLEEKSEKLTFDEDLTESAASTSTDSEKVGKKRSPFEYRRFTRGYMDDPLNTDQAWLELELWHIHFNIEIDLESKFKPGVHWELLDENILQKMQEGLAVFIKSIATSMEATF